MGSRAIVLVIIFQTFFFAQAQKKPCVDDFGNCYNLGYCNSAKSYKGRKAETKSGMACTAWNKIPKNLTTKEGISLLRPKDQRKNYCRALFWAEPWCFYIDNDNLIKVGACFEECRQEYIIVRVDVEMLKVPNDINYCDKLSWGQHDPCDFYVVYTLKLTNKNTGVTLISNSVNQIFPQDQDEVDCDMKKEEGESICTAFIESSNPEFNKQLANFAKEENLKNSPWNLVIKIRIMDKDSRSADDLIKESEILFKENGMKVKISGRIKQQKIYKARFSLLLKEEKY